MRITFSPTILVLFLFGTVAAQTTMFSYQGSLKDNGTLANGAFQMQFKLFDSLAGSGQIGSTINDVPVTVNQGIFTVKLDFGSNALSGADRWLEIAIRRNSGESYTSLSPREQIASSPYTVRTLSAANAENATTSTNALNLGGVAANQYVQTNDTRLSDARNPLPNSSFYVRNSTAAQTASFNISGDGTVGGTLTAGTLSMNIVNANQQFSIGGDRILSNPFATDSLFAGRGAGQNTTGSQNSFFGSDAGRNTTTGLGNSFFGWGSGFQNTNGTLNAFYGQSAGRGNTSGSENAIFGPAAGLNTSTGSFNSFFGSVAGYSNAAGSSNSAFGYQAGYYNTGNFNSFFGKGTAYNSTGNYNAFFGTAAGVNNLSGNFNTLLGYNTDVGAGNLTYATAVGSGAVVSASNTLVLGRALDSVKVPGALDVFGPVTGQFVLGAVNGGTGLNSSGASGNFLRSNGATWISGAILAPDIPPGSQWYIRNDSISEQAASFNILGNGRIGNTLRIGATNQSHKLAIEGGPSWTTGLWNGSVEIANVGAIGWRPNSSSLSFGIGQTNSGFHIFNTTSPLGGLTDPANNILSLANNGNVGVNTPNPTAGKLVVTGEAGNGVGIAINGNTVQSADRSGWVKAMLYVDGGGTVLSCYNGVTGNSTLTGQTNSGCGFSVNHGAEGNYSVNLGFPTLGRFISITTKNEGEYNASGEFDTVGNFINVYTFSRWEYIPPSGGRYANRSFMLLVF